MKVLIAYDGSESADTAIGGLTRAGLPIEADALVVSVAEVWLPTPEHEASFKDSFPSNIVCLLLISKRRNLSDSSLLMQTLIGHCVVARASSS